MISACAAAHMHGRLQQLIDCFYSYCVEHGLTINPSKCEVVVYASRRTAWAQHSWHVGSHPLPRSQKFKYLGIELHATGGIKAAIQQRLSCMFAAQSTVNRRLRELHMPRDPALMADLFESITATAGSYGCEIWSTPFLNDWHLRDCPLQRYQASVYKHTLGVPRRTSNMLMFFELGKYPMQVQWLQRTVNYWNKLVADQANSPLLVGCLRAQVHHGLQHEHTCWASELHAGLRFICPERDWRTHLLELQPITEPKGLTDLAKTKFVSSIDEFEGDPTDPECPHRQRCKFRSWMLTEPENNQLLQPPAYVGHNMPLNRKHKLAQFRMSGANIRCNTEHGISFSQRICQRCHSGVDDEHHLLFVCTAAGLQEIREQHSHLFQTANDSVKTLMRAAYDETQVESLSRCMSQVMGFLEGWQNEGQPVINTGS